MIKRILVTGGAGFVGSNLANNLLSDGLEVTVFDALLRGGSEEISLGSSILTGPTS